MRVFCDFDGTISVEDATDLVLSQFADPEWQDIERQWNGGLIGSAECMRRQIGLIRASRYQLDSLLDTVSIDPGFRDLLSFCIRHGVPMTVVSDGVDYFIKRILARHGIHSLPVIANVLSHATVDGLDTYALTSPLADPFCVSGAGVCKCLAIAADRPRIFVGDGRSDFCVSDKPDVVFAKGALAEHCAECRIPFIGFTSFAELPLRLEEMLPDLGRRGGTLRETIPA
jgi:2-hydroxy-3-keto-5-methylthiopentenyl-1-phosphate phosphatase